MIKDQTFTDDGVGDQLWVARCRNQNAATWDKTAIRRRYRRRPIMPGENGSRSVLVIAFIVIGPIRMPINVVK